MASEGLPAGAAPLGRRACPLVDEDPVHLDAAGVVQDGQRLGPRRVGEVEDVHGIGSLDFVQTLLGDDLFDELALRVAPAGRPVVT
jgi:hypothetical protein